jgi:ribosomal protein S18 acetylase RimI-like enzyme
MQNSNDPCRFTVSDSPTKEEINTIRKGLEEYNREQTNGEYDEPGIEINLVLKDSEGNVVGGINASTMLRVMHLEALWVADEVRKLGYGRELVLAAERIGFEKGCITSQTWSLSFQAPGFYQKIGYEVLGVYDGYPDGITETVLMKRLRLHHEAPLERNGIRRDGHSWPFSITEDVTQEEMAIVHRGLGRFVDEQIGDKRDGIKINLATRDPTEGIIGGLLAFTTMSNMIVEHLWIDTRHRRLGLGRKLVLEAERIAQESGCIAAQTYALSFQAPGFFQKLGYETFGISDGYPDPVHEYYLIKRLKAE